MAAILESKMYEAYGDCGDWDSKMAAITMAKVMQPLYTNRPYIGHAYC
jgi:hypothetical protein